MRFNFFGLSLRCDYAHRITSRNANILLTYTTFANILSLYFFLQKRKKYELVKYELVIECFLGVSLPTSCYARVGKVGVLRANGATPHPPTPWLWS
ncbi:MAG: hypothetical protein NZ455_13410 [Bacteroidia bacterium]|nr:hypothetical protein [Bacteroidia bacterium]